MQLKRRPRRDGPKADLSFYDDLLQRPEGRRAEEHQLELARR